MKKSGIFFSLILYSSVSIICANRVDTLNKLFTYPGWRAMSDLDYNSLRVIERWMEIEEHFYANDLIATNGHRQNVTNENAEYKTRQAHQFLSCKFALVLKQSYDIIAEFSAQCQRLSSLLNSNKCLNWVLLIVKENDKMILRMHSTLSFFYLLSPHTLFTKDVSDILKDILAFTRTKRYVDSRITTLREIIHAGLIGIDNDISKVLHRLWAFNYSVCYPIPPEEGEYGSSYYSRKRQKNIMTKYKGMHNLLTHTLSVMKEITNRFIKLFDNSLGFCFEPISKTTLVIKKDPLTVLRMNLLLKTPGWTALDLLDIKQHCDNQISVVELLKPSPNKRTSIVSYENLYTKSQMAHLILSCKYTLVLKECFDYAIFMWNQCEQNTDDIGSGVSVDNRLAQFKTTAEKSDPLMLRLRYALSFFYRLTPEMEYNKEVFNIIESFRTSFVVGDVTPNVENDMSAFLRRLRAFFEEFCWPQHLFDLTPSPEPTIDNDKLQVFINKINYFIETDFAKFGFVFV